MNCQYKKVSYLEYFSYRNIEHLFLFWYTTDRVVGCYLDQGGQRMSEMEKLIKEVLALETERVDISKIRELINKVDEK